MTYRLKPIVLMLLLTAAPILPWHTRELRTGFQAVKPDQNCIPTITALAPVCGGRTDLAAVSATQQFDTKGTQAIKLPHAAHVCMSDNLAARNLEGQFIP